jgi:MFS family permease
MEIATVRHAAYTKIPSRTWFCLTLLGLSGQIAWGIENSWFNTFVYDTLTPDPRPVAWMVGVSAITATLTTIFMGTLSDRTRSRLGRRKPYILFGYILWGLATALFPTVSFIKSIGAAVVMVIIADAAMTFFGSTANDAAFNAWTADVTDKSNRGRVESVLQITVFGANIVAFVAAGVIIDTFGYFFFFYTLGALVILSGIVAGTLMREAPLSDEELNRPRGPYLKEIMGAFRWRTVRENKILFLLFTNILIASIAGQITFPYMIVYFENFLGFTKAEFGLMAGGVLMANVVLAIPFGILADRVSRRKMLLIVTVVWSAATFAFSFARSLPGIIGVALVLQPMAMVMSIAAIAWMKDLLPESNRGQFLGIRMIFWIAIPMVVGPAIGSTLIRAYGIPTMLNQAAGFIPTPHIWWANALIGLLSLIPLLLMREERTTTWTGVQSQETS